MFARQITPLDHDVDSITTKAFALLDNNKPLIDLYDHPKKSFEKVLVLSLMLSSFDPSKKEKIGVFWLDDYHFALRTKNFSKTYGISISGINKNFQFHHIVQVGKIRHEELQEFEDKDNWRIMKDETNNFRRSKVMIGCQHLLKFDPQLNKGVKTQTNTEILNIGEELSLNDIEETFIEPEFDFASLIAKSEEEINSFWGNDEIFFDNSLYFL